MTLKEAVTLPGCSSVLGIAQEQVRGGETPRYEAQVVLQQPAAIALFKHPLYWETGAVTHGF